MSEGTISSGPPVGNFNPVRLAALAVVPAHVTFTRRDGCYFILGLAGEPKRVMMASHQNVQSTGFMGSWST